MRAAAAERRLAGIAGPSTGVKAEEDDLKPMKDDESDDELVDVPDPHKGAQERKREMEVEMDQAERRDLRGGYEEYLEEEPAERGIKREIEGDQTGDRPPAKRGTLDKVGIGADMVKKERLRSLGMSQTTLSTSSNVLGKRPKIGIEDASRPDVKPAISKDWACQVCTFVNPADQGLCGE